MHEVCARVRRAVARTPAADRTPLPELNPALVRQLAEQADLVELYCARAGAVGLATSVTRKAQLGPHIATILQNLEVRSAALEPGLLWHHLISAALTPTVALLPPAQGDETMYAVDAGITGVSVAVAETGSFVCPSGAGLWRGLSLIPPVHVALLRREQIVPDLLDLFRSVESLAPQQSRLPAHTTLITGPSKTADIEGILITGVHGPGKVHVCIVTPD